MDLEKIRKAREAQQLRNEKVANLAASANRSKAIREAVNTGSLSATKSASNLKAAVDQNTSVLAGELKQTSENIAGILTDSNESLGGSLNNILVATLMARDPQLVQIAKDFTLILENLAQANDNLKGSPLNEIPIVNKQLVKALNDFTKQESKEPDYTAKFDALEKALKGINIQPVVNVPKSGEVNLKPLETYLKEIVTTLENNKVEMPDINFEDVIAGLKEVQQTIAGLSFPVPNFVLPFVGTDGKSSQSPLPLVNKAYDAVTLTLTDSVTETYAFKSGGINGTTVSTITVVYTDATKATLSSVART